MKSGSGRAEDKNHSDQALEKELDELLDLLEEAADEEGLPSHIKGTGTG